MRDTTLDDRLRRAVERGSEAEMAAWAATGRAGLEVLREVLSQRRPPAWSGISSRAALDNLAAAVVRIAAVEPAAFLDVFDDEVLASDSFVLDGLGEIDDPRATRRLLRALRTDDSLIRVHAVMALGRHSRSLAVAALAAALSDREYLVRYHALRGLAAMGDASALPALAAFDRDTEVEGELAAQATAAIRGRTTGADTLRIP